MRVFIIETDVNNFASLEIDAPPPTDPGGLLRFDGTPRAPSWQPLAVRTYDRRAPRPDIFQLIPAYGSVGSLVFTERALQVVGTLAERSGELLPLRLGEETLFLLNVTRVVEDSLDPEKALCVPPEKRHVHIEPFRYAFLPERLPAAGIFHIPEAVGRLLCAEDVGDQPGFRRVVDEAGITGLNFRLVWDPELAQEEELCRERIIGLLREYPGKFRRSELLNAVRNWGAVPLPEVKDRYDIGPKDLVFRVYCEVTNVPGVDFVGEGLALKGTAPAPPPTPAVRPPAPLRRAGDAVALLEELGCHNPRGWAESQEHENIPQVAIYTFMRSLWPNLINTWSERLSWLERLPSGTVERLVGSEEGSEELGRLAASVAYAVVFDLMAHLDAGGDPTAPDDAPGWQLVETDSSGQPTGRTISGGLHEVLLELDPSGRQGNGLLF